MLVASIGMRIFLTHQANMLVAITGNMIFLPLRVNMLVAIIGMMIFFAPSGQHIGSHNR